MMFGFRFIVTGPRGCAGKQVRSDGAVRNLTQHFHLALRTGCSISCHQLIIAASFGGAGIRPGLHHQTEN